jgi:hypothetical protein
MALETHMPRVVVIQSPTLIQEGETVTVWQSCIMVDNDLNFNAVVVGNAPTRDKH